MEEATKLISLDSLLTLNNLVLIVAIQVILGVVKSTLDKFNLLKKMFVEILLPYTPIVMGVVASFIPGVIEADTLGTRLLFGIALGGISGQTWKALWKNNIDLLNGKLGE